MKTISFIGAGNMAYAMAGALFNQNPNIPIGIYDINKDRLDLFTKSFSSTKCYNSIKELTMDSDIIVLAVKPQIIEKILPEIRDFSKIIISIAAGVTLKYLTKELPNPGIARVMPNTPSLVGKMAAGVSFSGSMNVNQKAEVLEFLSYSGIALEVEEKHMDAVTGISGSGPAFVARIMDQFIKAGIKQGLDEDVAKSLTLNTFLGTAQLLIEKDMVIEDLITMVSSPGGTTIAGRGVLESSEIGSIIDNTVDATVKRSIELGQK
ncbi:MAG: pyrroline-5-carboxylate reductase [Spirochaetaceae bacterium]